MKKASPLDRALSENKELRDSLDKLRGQVDQARADAQAISAAGAGRSKDIDDLKERLAVAEKDNQFMRGYIARVQEDDVVREELVLTGDPEGQTVKVPKRKHTAFPAPNDYAGPVDPFADALKYRRFEEATPKQKPRHWVTY